MNDIQEYVEDIYGCDKCISQYFYLLSEHIENAHIENGVVSVWEVLKKFKVDPLEWKNEIRNLKCPKCGEKIKLNSILIITYEEFYNDLIEKVSGYINDYIEECQYCNSDIIPFTQRYSDPMMLKTVSELLNENGITKELGRLYYDIIERITCKCGNELDLEDPYVTRYDIESWYGERDVQIIIDTFNISEYDAKDFISYLYKYPMMALRHRIGISIYENIQNNLIDGIRKLEEGEVMYRARKRNVIDRKVPFIESELWAPPLGVSNQGRFNPVGVGLLYLCDSHQTGMKEIDLRCNTDEVCDIATFVTLSNLKVWDTRNLDIEDWVLNKSLNNSNISREYLLSNFLSQCFSQSDINGIIYKSVKNPSGWNLVLLNYEENRTIALVDICEECKLAKKDKFIGSLKKEVNTDIF